MGRLRSTLNCNPRNGAQLKLHTVGALSALLYESQPVTAATKTQTEYNQQRSVI